MENGNSILGSLKRERTEVEEARRYWHAALSGEPKPAAIRAESGDSNAGGSYASIPLLWPDALAPKLLGLARGEDTLLNAVLLSGLAVVVYKYGGDTDFLLGSPAFAAGGLCSGGGGAPAVGNEVLPVRCRLGGAVTVKELLKAMNVTVADAYRYQDYPFREAPGAWGGREARYDAVGCELTNIHDPQALFGRRLDGTNEIAVTVTRRGDSLEGSIVYAAALFDRRSALTMAEAYLHVLEQMADHPDAPVSSLELLREPMRARILEAFCRNAGEAAKPVPTHRVFEEIAAAAPHRAAVNGGGERLTYGELDERANALAVRLRRRGAAAGSIVGIMLERSVDLVTAVLAVWKAGCAYLPLDPVYPEARLRYMAEDSGMSMLLTHARLAGRVVYAGATVILDDGTAPGGDEPGSCGDLTDDSPLQPDEDRLAYVIYTSGSTGMPKGVMVGHRSIANLRDYIARELAITPEDRIVQFASASFDASVWELLMAVCTGAELYLPPPDALDSFERFTDYMNRNGITIATLPPPFAAHLEPERMRSLRMLLTGGSAAHPELVRRWKGHVAYVNAYGPTEAAVVATTWMADGVDVDSEAGPDGLAGELAGTVPIGRPITNNEIYILGPDGRMQPPGVMGELHIGGAGVAMGYLGRPELTAERFVPNPFRPGENMYRSGDYARWLPDGNIAYMGRIDHQVKIRGYRIETGEIENGLLRHPAVKQAVVAPRSEPAGEAVLYAYYVASGLLGEPAVKEWLAERLPAYMIPQRAIRLDAMPLTVNGKIDLAALPSVGAAFGEELGADATETERELSRLWGLVLGGGPYGSQANFFDAGGHSLRAALLIAEIHRRFRVQLTLRELMEAPTLRAMAAAIEGLEGGAYEPIPPAGLRSVYPLSPAQLRLYVLGRFEPESVAYNLPSALRIEGALDIDRLQDAFRALIARHETLRTSFMLEAGLPVQVVHDAADVPFDLEVVVTDEDDRDALALQSAARRFIRPFEPERAPLFRVRALRYPSGRHLLLTDMHHLVADGISASVFVRDLLACYAGATPAPLPVQYKDFACWQADRLAQGGMKEQETYWLSRFRSPAPAPDGLVDYPRQPGPPSDEADAVVRTIPEERTARLRELAAANGATLYMVLLSAYSMMLSRRAGVEDIVVGTPVAGRRHADLQPLVGMFINMLPMRTRPEAGLTCRTYLREVMETTLNGLEHQDYPFDELVSKLGVPRDFGRNPLFDASFALQNIDRVRIEAEGLSIEPAELQHRSAKFDLTLWAEESEGQGLLLTLEYRTSLFRRETGMRMQEDLATILARMADDPDGRLGDIKLLADADRREKEARLARLAQELDMEFDL